jgi:hypothetical protein
MVMISGNRRELAAEAINRLPKTMEQMESLQASRFCFAWCEQTPPSGKDIFKDSPIPKKYR